MTRLSSFCLYALFSLLSLSLLLFDVEKKKLKYIYGDFGYLENLKASFYFLDLEIFYNLLACLSFCVPKTLDFALRGPFRKDSTGT